MKQNKSFFSKIKLPHAFTLLFGILIIVGIISLILSWFGVQVDVQTAGKDGKLVTETKKILGGGVLDWFTAIPAGFYDATYLIIFLFVLGGYLNVVIKSKALDAFIGKIAQKLPRNYKKVPEQLKITSPFNYYFANFKEGVRQTWLIIPLMLFFSFSGTTYGMAEESLAFYAILIPLAVAAGFDVFTGFLIVFLGAGIGVMASTVNIFSVGAAIDSAESTSLSDVDKNAGVIWRWISWLIMTSVAIGTVSYYAARVKSGKTEGKLADMFEIHKKSFNIGNTTTIPILTFKRKIIVGLFLGGFLIMVFGMINWDELFNLKSGVKNDDGKSIGFFKNIETNWFGSKNGGSVTSWFHNSAITEKMKGGPAWGFGQWYLLVLATYFFIISLIIGLLTWKNDQDYIEKMLFGAKDMLGVIFAIGIARSISVFLSASNLTPLFAKGVSSAIKGAGAGKSIGKVTVPILSYILFIPLCFVIPSTSGLANATFPVLSNAIVDVKDTTLFSGTVTGFAWGAGFANMFVPTYGVVIGALALTRISYEKFFSIFWKFLVVFFLLGLFLITFGGLINLAGFHVL